jgi:uncharacterized protein
MIDLQLWLVIAHNTEVDRAPLRAAHREYMADLVARGAIFASGPIAPGPDGESHGGATALLVTDEAEARRIMDNEPFVRGGARTYDLVAWHVRHGTYASH